MGITEMGVYRSRISLPTSRKTTPVGKLPSVERCGKASLYQEKKQLVLGMPGLPVPESRGPLRGLRAGMRTRAPWGVTM